MMDLFSEMVRLLEEDLNSVDNRMFSRTDDQVSRFQVTNILERIGVKKLSDKDLVKHHILHSLKDKEKFKASILEWNLEFIFKSFLSKCCHYGSTYSDAIERPADCLHSLPQKLFPTPPNLLPNIRGRTKSPHFHFQGHGEAQKKFRLLLDRLQQLIEPPTTTSWSANCLLLQENNALIIN